MRRQHLERDGCRRLAAAVAVAWSLLVGSSPSGVSLHISQRPSRVHVSGTQFATADREPFQWRGITAFRLLEFVAHKREREAERYLAWAEAQGLNGVRVLAMAKVLFALPPGDGERVLDRLLDLADRHHMVVEIVALADTAQYTFDVRAHVAAIGRSAARHSNILVELANEPYHPTQSRDVHDHAFLRALRDVVPRDVPVSLGTLDERGDLAAGDYITWHSSREGDWAERTREGGELLRRFNKPVIADEPMGAAARAARDRRDNVPEHFARAARICRKIGLGATFHYEGGLQARRPDAVEARCLAAWLAELK